jgi:transposase
MARREELPKHSRDSVMEQLDLLDQYEERLKDYDRQIQDMLYPSAERNLLDTLPCVGSVLSAVLAAEIGEVGRFSGLGPAGESCGAGAGGAGERGLEA